MRNPWRFYFWRALLLLSYMGSLVSCAPLASQVPASVDASPSIPEANEPEIEEPKACRKPPEAYESLPLIGCELSAEGRKVCAWGLFMNDGQTEWQCIVVLQQRGCNVNFEGVLIQCKPPPGSEPTEL